MSSAISLNGPTNFRAARTATTAASISLTSTAIALVCLAALHVLSPEFDPSWRMVSEYALGDYSWVLTALFITWAIGTWTLAYAVKDEVKTTGGRIGLFFLVLAGVGEAMAALFDVRHSLHGLAATIGMPSLPVAALLISYSLKHNEAWAPARKRIILTAHLTWISIVLLTIAVMVLFDGFAKAGIDMSSGTAPSSLPEGVIAFAGWANRLLILTYCIWMMTVAVYKRKLGEASGNH
jgi:hypothetical protein